MIKEYIRALGVNPEEVLARDAMTQPATTCRDMQERENLELKIPVTYQRKQWKILYPHGILSRRQIYHRTNTQRPQQSAWPKKFQEL